VGVVDSVRTGLRCVGYGEGLPDKLNIAARLALYPVFPVGLLAQRLGRPLPDPARLLPGYRVRTPEGVWSCPPGPAPYFLGADTSYEPALMRRLAALDGGTLLDIGANIGFVTVRAARRLAGVGHVIAVEPHPVRFAHLRENVERNRLHNVTCVNCALGDVNGEATLHDVPQVLGPRARDVSLIRAGDGPTYSVPLRRLDDVLAELAPVETIAFVKIDVEGFESQVLAGMPQVLAAGPPVAFEALDETAAAAARAALPDRYRIVRLDDTGFIAAPSP
jgi:FkbM family methyltransferase